MCLFIILQAYVSNPIRNIDNRRNLKLEFILNHPYYKFKNEWLINIYNAKVCDFNCSAISVDTNISANLKANSKQVPKKQNKS